MTGRRRAPRLPAMPAGGLTIAVLIWFGELILDDLF